jgi:2-hydroxy-3-keto-5-methylthiopentenyl-1-phosphate phosphatase
MKMTYKAMVSSDWSECLSPSGPFDFISYNFPQLESQLSGIFRQYTGNRITLGEAAGKIKKLLPEPVTPVQMDAYLDAAFMTYTGVPELIDWCLNRDILFMINTTGMIGYFQRVFAQKRLPRVPVLSANPMVRYPEQLSDPHHVYELFETVDKGKNTAKVAQTMGIPPEKVILLGDSGGDGPHFEWGDREGAFLIGSMTKPSLDDYCRDHQISVNLRFGLDYSKGEKKDNRKEMQINFMDLRTVIEQIVSR